MWKRALPAGLARALALSLLALAASGCGGTKLLKNPEPAPALPVIAESKDARIAATVEAVIVRNGPGSWAKDASWDEYLIQVRNASEEPIRVTGIAIWDSLGTRLEPRTERADLVEASEQSERRYKDRGLTVQAGSGSPWLVAGAIGTTAVVAGAAMAGSAASGAGMLAGAAAGAAVIGALVWGGVGLAWYGIARAVNHREVNTEIRRRQAILPETLAGAQGTRFHVFFPYAPSPSRIAIAYADAKGGDHQLDLDTSVLRGLHLGTAPAALVPPRPSEPAAVTDVSGPLPTR